MEKLLTSQQSISLLPPILSQSGWLRPLLSFALLPSAYWQRTVQQSQLVQKPIQLLANITKPFAGILQHPGFTRLVAGIHVLSLVALLCLTTFASTNVIALAVIATFVLMLLRTVASPNEFKVTLVDLLVFLFFITAMVGTLFSSYQHTSWIGLAKFLVFLAGFIHFRAYFSQQPQWILRCFWILLALGATEALIGFYQYLNHIQPLATWQDTSLNPEDQMTRIFGTLKPSNPNLLAGFLIPCLTSGIGLALHSLFSKRWLSLLISGSLSAFILLALVLTGSRGGFLALALMGSGTFMLIGHLLWHEPSFAHRYKLKGLWLLTGITTILSVAIALVGVSALRTRVLSIFAMREDSSNSYRLNVWASTWRLIQDNWLLGIGPGNDTFKQVYGLYMVPGYNALGAYSIFLEMWAEQGILGLLTFILLITVVKIRTLWVFYTTLPLTAKLTMGMLCIGILSSVVYGLFDTIWYRPSVNLLFWLYMAAFATQLQRYDTEENGV